MAIRAALITCLEPGVNESKTLQTFVAKLKERKNG